jgi:alkylhydroperoxidase/carboxymuconolactone decarboxylase family protein YurZ
MDRTASTDAESRRAAGMAIRAKVLGEAWDETSRTSPGLSAFTDVAIDHIWSGEWIDPTLPLREKSLITISTVATRQHLGLLKFHVAGALRLGTLNADEIRAVILHLNPYIGYPTARDAMIVADQAIAEHEAAQ